MTIPPGTSLDDAATIADEARASRDAEKMKEVEAYILANLPNKEARMHTLEWIRANIEGIESGGDPTPMSSANIQKRLESQHGYSAEEAKAGASWLLNVFTAADAALSLWWRFDKIADLSAHGISLSELIDRFGHTPPAAIALLDALYRMGPDVRIGPVAIIGDPFKKRIKQILATAGCTPIQIRPFRR